MAGRFTDILDVLSRLRAEGIVVQYAIAGATAVTIWDAPVATQDVDVVVMVAARITRRIRSVPVLTWLADHGVALEGGHAPIGGVPVQFLPAWNAVVAEGVERAAEVRYDPADPASSALRVMLPTYLVASWEGDPPANSPRRRERAARLREADLVDEALLTALLKRLRP